MTETNKLFIDNEIGDATELTPSLQNKMMNDIGLTKTQFEELFQWRFSEQEVSNFCIFKIYFSISEKRNKIPFRLPEITFSCFYPF